MAKIAINLKEGKVIKNEVIVGIDLGTTNSLVAYINNGVPECIKDEFGKNTLVPSIIHFDSDGKIVVGNSAKEYLIEQPENTIYSVKRLIGKSVKEINNHNHTLNYKIYEPDPDAMVRIQVGNKFYSPVELSSEILKTLKKQAEKHLNAEVNKAVITVPAYFNDIQRQATRDAGKLAGLEVLRIINEPTAASLAYGFQSENKLNQTIAVYDLGGGTFDISILQLEDGIYEVLATNGDTYLGGDNIDQLIAENWVSQLGLSSKTLKERPKLNQEIRLKAEEAKIALSQNNNFETLIEGMSLAIDLETFNKLIEPLIKTTLNCCSNALKDSGITISSIDHIIMVGGSTRIPYIKNRVSEYFGKKLFDNINPDEVVALGAAIQADILAGNQKDILLLDVTPLSLGIETVGGLMDVLIPRNNRIPFQAGRQYTTSVDGQKNLKISIYQGERELVSDNRKLAEFILSNIPPMPAGIPKIEITFTLNADGILKVKAKELRSNTEQEIEVKSTYDITEEEMALMLLDSIKNAEEDIKTKAILEAVNEANGNIMATTKFLNQNKDWLSDNDINTILSLQSKLLESVEAKDKDLIYLNLEQLNEYSEPLAQLAMDKIIQQSLKGKKI